MKSEPGPEYHNPYLLVWLIGLSNEALVIINDVVTTALIDMGAQVSTISDAFCEWLGLEVKPLQTILNMEGAGGYLVPYSCYV